MLYSIISRQPPNQAFSDCRPPNQAFTETRLFSQTVWQISAARYWDLNNTFHRAIDSSRHYHACLASCSLRPDPLDNPLTFHNSSMHLKQHCRQTHANPNHQHTTLQLPTSNESNSQVAGPTHIKIELDHGWLTTHLHQCRPIAQAGATALDSIASLSSMH